MEDLKRCPANYPPLTPIGFIERAATVYGDCTSLVYNTTRFTWSQTFNRCLKLASALSSRNISHGDVVSVVAPNVPAIYELHFAVPMAGAVLNNVNIRLDARTMAAQFTHCEPKFLFVDYQFLPIVREALSEIGHKPCVVVIEELDNGREMARSGALTYEGLIGEGDPEFKIRWPEDEWQSAVLNYTSGTTSAPKGVVHSHRGLYTMAMDNLLMWGMTTRPVYLWTLAMFHANGWCFPWTLAAVGATNICLRKFDAKTIFDALAEHGVTHMCGAPVVLSMMANAHPSEHKPVAGRVEILTAGAPPPAAILWKVEDMGFAVTHGYGLTETAGLVVSCAWKAEWDTLPAEERARLKARQGARNVSLAEVDVKDPTSMASVAKDGLQTGEVMVRGASVMKGYLKNERMTALAMDGGWFRTGDVGVLHPDGYLEIKDRSKDVIISGGENISSVEVESVLYSHPLIAEAAVVGRPDSFWGETPCAFVNIGNKGTEVLTEAQVISFCRERIAHFMAPKSVIFVKELPKTSTGKVQKYLLRDIAKKLPSCRLQVVAYARQVAGCTACTSWHRGP
ncbi:hypothetical protein KI387_012359, partial [Taxus chinensis]